MKEVCDGDVKDDNSHDPTLTSFVLFWLNKSTYGLQVDFNNRLNVFFFHSNVSFLDIILLPMFI